MKVRASVKKCAVTAKSLDVTGHVRVICSVDPKHKQRQG